MQTKKQPWKLLASGILLVGLAGVLILNLAIVIDLPSRVYTAEQLAYLDYNRGRSISQLPPAWNIIVDEGLEQPPVLSYVRENRVRARLDARYEEQDGVSVTVYDLDFRGEYRLVYGGSRSTVVELFFPFPDNLETLHEVRLLVDGEEPLETVYSTGGIGWNTVMRPGEERQVLITYQADGANSFAYGLYWGQRSDVDVIVEVVGLAGSTVPRNSLPTTGERAAGDGEVMTWDYDGLIVDRDVQLTLPSRLSFAQRIAESQDEFRVLAGLAPFLVGLFLVSLAAVFYLGRVHLGLESYLLAGCGMALFFPLLIFLSGVVDLIAAAVLALALVSGLLVLFVHLASGWRQSRWRVAVLLVIFLGCFSLGILTPWPGLMLTCGGLLLVGTLMLLYARRPPAPQPEPLPQPVAPRVETAPGPAPGEGATHEAEQQPGSAPLLGAMGPASEPEGPPAEATPTPEEFFCPYCARVLAGDFSFCPGCGHDTEGFRLCDGCGVRQSVPIGMDAAHCIHCGQSLD